MEKKIAQKLTESHPHVKLSCTAVQIGSYKVKPHERITISSEGITLPVPIPHIDSSIVNVWLPIKDIENVLVCFCRSLPAMFVCCRNESSVSVRKVLHMNDSKGPYYYDPVCNDDTQKRITILPEEITEEMKVALKAILKSIQTEITRGLAHELLDSISNVNPLQSKAKGGLAQEDAEKEEAKNQHVLLSCRTVRIGSYKVKPSEEVAILRHGIEIHVPLPEDDSTQVKLWLPYSDMYKILVSFSRTLPVIFVYYKADCAATLREALCMNDPQGTYYFDPESSDEAQKRITFLPDKMIDEVKVGLRSVFQNVEKVTEINQKLSNDILVKSSPRESFQCLEMPTRPDISEASSKHGYGTSVKNPNVRLFCRTIRIGTFEAKPNECVTVTPHAIELHIPLPSINPCVVHLTVPLIDLKKTLISFSRSMPVIFLYLRPNCAAKIREMLHMTVWNKFYYFDPDSDEMKDKMRQNKKKTVLQKISSGNKTASFLRYCLFRGVVSELDQFDSNMEAHKRIILLPEEIPEDAELNLKSIFQYPHQKFMAEIYNKLANDILMKSYPNENLYPEPCQPNEKFDLIN